MFQTALQDPAAHEDEVRAVLLKAGGNMCPDPGASLRSLPGAVPGLTWPRKFGPGKSLTQRINLPGHRLH